MSGSLLEQILAGETVTLRLPNIDTVVDVTWVYDQSTWIIAPWGRYGIPFSARTFKLSRPENFNTLEELIQAVDAYFVVASVMES